jgi:hypothetical protein
MFVKQPLVLFHSNVPNIFFLKTSMARRKDFATQLKMCSKGAKVAGFEEGIKI